MSSHTPWWHYEAKAPWAQSFSLKTYYEAKAPWAQSYSLKTYEANAPWSQSSSLVTLQGQSPMSPVILPGDITRTMPHEQSSFLMTLRGQCPMITVILHHDITRTMPHDHSHPPSWHYEDNAPWAQSSSLMTLRGQCPMSTVILPDDITRTMPYEQSSSLMTLRGQCPMIDHSHPPWWHYEDNSPWSQSSSLVTLQGQCPMITVILSDDILPPWLDIYQKTYKQFKVHTTGMTDIKKKKMMHTSESILVEGRQVVHGSIVSCVCCCSVKPRRFLITALHPPTILVTDAQEVLTFRILKHHATFSLCHATPLHHKTVEPLLSRPYKSSKSGPKIIKIKEIYDGPDLVRNTTALGAYNSKSLQSIISRIHQHTHIPPHHTHACMHNIISTETNKCQTGVLGQGDQGNMNRRYLTKWS